MASKGTYAFDEVPRLMEFRAAHPEIDIMTPADTGSPFWKALHDGEQVTVQHDLGHFLDALDEWLAKR